MQALSRTQAKFVLQNTELKTFETTGAFQKATKFLMVTEETTKKEAGLIVSKMEICWTKTLQLAELTSRFRELGSDAR